MMILILNFDNILNLDYYNILCSSDKGKIFPLSELQKIPYEQTITLLFFNLYYYIIIYLPFIFIYIHSLNVFFICYWLIYTPMTIC